MAAESGSSDENVVIDVESLVSYLENEWKNPGLTMPTSYCIFKTPSILSRHKPNSFYPNLFSIGPMHRGKLNLVPGERIKVKYLDGLLSRVLQKRTPARQEIKEVEKKRILRELLFAVKLVEKQANACYGGHNFAAILGAEFVGKMVLDGVFIIELFRKYNDEVSIEDDDPIFSMSCMLQFLHHDLILLENQIPWLVLEILFENTKLPSETKCLIELTLRFFATIFTSYPLINLGHFAGQDIKHILDLLRLSLVLPCEEIKRRGSFSSKRKEEWRWQWQPIPSATRLKEAGVKLKNVNAASILDIKFNNGVLEIPNLLIQETTETIFRNLISYEQCLPQCTPIFTCYAMILSNLIDTTEDTQILVKKGILDSWVGLHEATSFFDKLYSDAFVNEFYYSELAYQLSRYCQGWWPKWRSAYVHNYLSNSWIVAVIVAQLYALTTFALLFLQTYYTIKK